MEPQDPGKSPHSGNGEVTKVKKRSAKSVNWKQAAADLALEVATLSKKVQEITSSQGLDSRDRRKLHLLEHFYRRMVNVSLCPEDRRKVDAVMADYTQVVRSGGAPEG